MPVPPLYANRYLYHFTHINNLSSILKNGLLSTNEKKLREITHRNIAENEIQCRRSLMEVTCGCGGVVHDYVPLYFCHRSPMLFRVLNETNNQGNIIYLVFPIQILEIYPSVFTDASANTSIPPNFYDNVSYLCNLSWDDIDKRYWGEQPAVIQKKQAEALIYKQLPLNLINSIIVENDFSKALVQVILKRNNFSIPSVIIDKTYFFG